jgi:hypothetical protein
VFLNKLDLLSEKGEAEQLAGLILGDESKQVERVVIGSIFKKTYSVWC